MSAYQDPNGQWLDDFGEPIDEPDDVWLRREELEGTASASGRPRRGDNAAGEGQEGRNGGNAL